MTRRLTTDRLNPSPAVMGEAVAVLRAGGVVAFPTDTLYGLAVDPRDPAAVRRLFEVKARGAAVALPLIAADVAQAEAVAASIGPPARRLMDAFWPGPLTLVLAAAEGLAEDVHAGRRTVAVRVPAHVVARDLAARFGFPLTSTSANPSGLAPAVTADDVMGALGGRVDLVIDAGPAPGGPASTIVDVTGDPSLVRAGAVPWDRVLESLK